MSVSSVHVNGEYNLSPLSRYYITATPRVPVELGDITRNVELINTGAEINIITLNLARRAGFPIRDGSRFINIISQTNYSREFYRMVEKIPVKIESAINTIPI